MGLNKKVRPNIGLKTLVVYLHPDSNMSAYVGFTFIFLLAPPLGIFICFLKLCISGIDDIYILTRSFPSGDGVSNNELGWATLMITSINYLTSDPWSGFVK